MIFKHLVPKTENAERFVEKYGGLFFVRGIQVSTRYGPVIRLWTVDETMITVQKRPDGSIYVNGDLFCNEW